MVWQKCSGIRRSYLVVAALLAGIVHGLDGNAPLPARVRGDGALAGGTPSPLRQCEALALFADDVRLPALLGERFCRLFHTCKTAELSEFERRVTATEIDWMLNNALYGASCHLAIAVAKYRPQKQPAPKGAGFFIAVTRKGCMRAT